MANACFCCVRFSFSVTRPRDWLGETSPKSHMLCRVGRKTTIQSVNLDYFLAPDRVSVRVKVRLGLWSGADVLRGCRQTRTEPQVTCAKKTGEDRTCSSEDMIADRQTDTHTHRRSSSVALGLFLEWAHCCSISSTHPGP